MRAFEVRPLLPLDIDEAFAWYEAKQVGLGADFADAAAAGAVASSVTATTSPNPSSGCAPA